MNFHDGEADDARDLGALSRWAPELAKTFVSLASDIALVIDDVGLIRNVAQGNGDPLTSAAHGWVGRPWIDTVSGETRPKIENLLKEVASTGLGRRREVNHPVAEDTGIPIAYTAIRLGRGGPVLAVGRDLRAIAAIQQRYVESQQEMERSYWKARQAEARYELLFQVATDAVVVIDAESFQIVEANDAALRLYQGTAGQVKGLPASFAFEHHSRLALTELLAEARRSGKSGEIRARLQGTHASTSVVAMSFRTHEATRLLVRVRTLDAVLPTASTAPDSSTTLTDTLSRLVDPSRDGVVVTDSSGRICVANPAFLGFARLASESDLTGQPLTDWLNPTGQPIGALIAQVRRDGIVRQVESCVRQPGGALQRVSVSAALLTEGDQECIGFTMHPIGSSAKPGSDGVQEADGARDTDIDALAEALRGQMQRLALQVGIRPTADLVGEATTLAERYFAAVGALAATTAIPAIAEIPDARGAEPC